MSLHTDPAAAAEALLAAREQGWQQGWREALAADPEGDLAYIAERLRETYNQEGVFIVLRQLQSTRRERDEVRAEVARQRDLLSRAAWLLSYFGDHGGGFGCKHPEGGECDQPCPQGDALALAAALVSPHPDTTDRNTP